jgi:SAM-dependent methyltransferase
MIPFDLYARYYDLLYRDKDYRAEAEYVSKLLREVKPGAKSVLELGCGTGGHAAHFAALGYRLAGVDLSATMVERARAKAEAYPEAARAALSFSEGDVRTVRLNETFDTVISLFHVMSYQTTDADLRDAIRTAAAHLAPGGAFYFDFWHGPAVLSDPPTVRVKRIEDARIRVVRVTEPVPEPENDVIDVRFEVFIEDKNDGAISRVEESHRMRYLFADRMEALLREGGFSVVSAPAWMSRDALTAKHWYGGILCRKDAA